MSKLFVTASWLILIAFRLASTNGDEPINITNVQTKSTNAANLPAVLLQEIAELHKEKTADKVVSLQNATIPTTYHKASTTTEKSALKSTTEKQQVKNILNNNNNSSISELPALKHNNGSTSTTSTTTTTTTTPKPKKPTVTLGMEDFPNLESAVPELQANIKKQQQQSSSSFPVPPAPEPPNAEPSLERLTPPSYKGGSDYMVPILTLLFTVPLAIGVIVVSYRRMRDFWSKRHYRRMDFLVDGMYND